MTHPIHKRVPSAQATKTYATNAALLDTDAIKQSIATAASIATYTGAALNGVIGANTMVPPRAVTATLASNAGSYTASSTIVITGTYNGATVTDTLTITGTDGGITLWGSQAFQTITSIVVAAQANTGGAFQFGVGDVFPPPTQEGFLAVEAPDADGSIKVQYPSHDDTLVVLKGSTKPVMAKRVYGNGTTTGLIVYWLTCGHLFQHYFVGWKFLCP